MRLRNRITKATFYTDPELCRWHRDKRAFYHSLWACAEDSACLEDDMFGVKLAAWPSPEDADMTVERFAEWRNELVACGKLKEYVGCDGKAYLYIPAMGEHEKPRNPQSPDLPLPPWVTWEINETDKRKGSYIHSYTVEQGLYNDPSTVPALPCTGLSSPVRPTDGVPSFNNWPKCFHAEYRDTGKTFVRLLTDSLSELFGPTWVMKATNLGKLADSILKGCPPDCDGSCVGQCASAFDAIAEKNQEKIGLIFYAVENDPRPWAERMRP